MGLISPGGQNLLDFLELRQVLSTYDGYLRDPLDRKSKQKTAYEMNLCDWSSDVCSSDLHLA